jgi:hypothetical protein
MKKKKKSLNCDKNWSTVDVTSFFFKPKDTAVSITRQRRRRYTLKKPKKKKNNNFYLKMISRDLAG